MTADEVAILVLLCHDVRARDLLIARCGDQAQLGQVVRMLRDLARRCPPEIAAPAWGMFGWASYCDGSGVAVCTAIERARSASPSYSLVASLAECLERQIHPAMLCDQSASFARDVTP